MQSGHEERAARETEKDKERRVACLVYVLSQRLRQLSRDFGRQLVAAQVPERSQVAHMKDRGRIDFERISIVAIANPLICAH